MSHVGIWGKSIPGYENRKCKGRCEPGQYHNVLMTVALQYHLKSGKLIPPAPFFFLQTALAIQGLLCFHMNCEIFCSNSVKNVIGNLIGIALNLQIVLGSIVIFTILILPTQEHEGNIQYILEDYLATPRHHNFSHHCFCLVQTQHSEKCHLVLVIS